MKVRKSVLISEEIYTDLTAAAQKQQLSIKDFTQAALVFFIHKNLNPQTYEPTQSLDLLLQMQKQHADLMQVLDGLNKEVFQSFFGQLQKSRLLQEALLSVVLDKLLDQEDEREEILSQIASHMHMEKEKDHPVTFSHTPKN